MMLTFNWGGFWLGLASAFVLTGLFALFHMALAWLNEHLSFAATVRIAWTILALVFAVMGGFVA